MEDDDKWGDDGWSDDENIHSNSEFSMFENFIIEKDYWSIFQNRVDLLKLDKDEKIKLSKLFKIQPNDCENDSYIAYLLCSGFVCHSPKDMNEKLSKIIFEYVSEQSVTKLRILFENLNLDPNVQDENKNNPIHFIQTVEIGKILRMAGAKLFLANLSGQTPIHSASSKNKGRIVSYILSFSNDPKSEINWPDSNGDSPFHYAVRYFLNAIDTELIDENDLEQLKIMFQSFLFASANPEMKNKNGESPRDLILKYFGLQSSIEASEEDLLDAVYDRYSTTEAKMIDCIISIIFEIQKKPEVEMNEPETASNAQEETSVERCFEHLDHTADIQIHSWGEKLDQAFINAALGMIDYMVPLERISIKKELVVECGPCQSQNEFLFNFMQEVLYVSACDPYFLPVEIEMILFDVTNRKMRCKLKGEEFNLKKHGGYGTEVKAITYSAMRIEQDEHQCNIWVIVDI